MQKSLIIILSILFLVPVIIRAENPPIERPKIGLVLSGGGAKGFAHIGTLKLLDSLQIPIDYIAGTSMGGIAGGLYAIGYSGKELEELAFRSDWQEIFSDRPKRPLLPYFQKMQTGKYQLEFGLKGFKPTPPSGLIYGQKISLLFSSLTFSYEHISNFDELPIPFRCVAVDLVTGNEVVLQSGSLARAMRATMAIPTIFSPVEWEDYLLVDGGLVNNLPVDVVRQMGADIIIAVDVGTPLLERSRLNSALNILEQTLSIVGLEKSRENLQLADIVIHPDMTGISPADFNSSKIKEILARGEKAASEIKNDLLALKAHFELQQVSESTRLEKVNMPLIVYGVQITGHTTIPFDTIYQQINLHPGDMLDETILSETLARMKASGYYDSIRYEIIPVSENYARLMFQVTEKEMPVIQGISVDGNRILPFLFIYRLLGLKPGDRLNIEQLNNRIMEMYGLGYFELIYYDIVPVDEKHIYLILKVKELPFRRLRVGLRYDDRHRLVAAVGTQVTNFMVPGLRFETELQFAGLNRFRFKAFYPSRALDLPVYPFFHLDYKDIPTNIFNESGDKMAEYKDRSTMVGIGLGIVLAKSLNTEIGYHYEWMDIEPNIAIPDPVMFPTWHDRLRQIRASIHLDLLDDVLLPREGFLLQSHFEGSFRSLNKGFEYKLMSASFDFYHTLNRRHTTRFFTFWGMSAGELPVYKFFNLGRPYYFVGVDYDQLFTSRLSILRLEYRYEYKRDIFLKLMFNYGFQMEHYHDGFKYILNNMAGAGAGVTFLSPIGPIEIIYARGDKTMLGPRKTQNFVYFSMGYKF